MKELFGTITVIFALYIVIVAVLLYLFGERNIIDNFSLAMSTLATGGFLPTSTILKDLIWQEHLILISAMILGALPFTFHYAFVRKRFVSPKLGREVLVYFAILTSAILIFLAISDLEPIMSIFYTVSASTTAGLQLTSLDSLNSASHILLIILMFIGGCGFSTAGGIKVYRFFFMKHFSQMIKKETRKKLSVENKKEITSATIIIVLFPLISIITAGHLMSVENVSFENAIFDSVGVITTGGLSSGVIDMETDSLTKIGLSLLMIIGRLEIIALIYIFVPQLS